MKIKNLSEIKSLLLENKTLKQTIFKNTFWLALGIGISKLLMLVLLIYVARILGATDYGKFSFAFAFISLFVAFYDFGLPSIVTREFSQEEEREKEFYSVLSLKILLSLGTLILILISSFFITSDPVIQKIILILTLFSLINSFLTIFYAFFQARQRMEYQTWTGILESVTITAIGIFILLNFPSIENLSYGYLIASLISLISVWIFFNIKIFNLKISWQTSVWRKFLIMSWPLALNGFFGMLYTYIDSTMMGYRGQIIETGWYNAAYKIINIVLIPAGLISASLYPILSKFFKESKEKLQKVWNYFLESMIFLAIPIVVGGIALAPRIIDWIYDPSFFPSGRETILAFQFLIVMAGITFLATPFSQILIVVNQQKRLFWVTLMGAIINVTLNLILIPRYSLYGAATTIAITVLFVLFFLFKFTLKFTPIRPLNLEIFFNFLGTIFATIPMYFLIIQPKIYHLNVILSILIGAGIYLICFSLYKKIIWQKEF